MMKATYLFLISLVLPPAFAVAAPITVIAKGVGVVPGAVVCHDLSTVRAMMDWYSQAWEDRMDSALTGGASQIVNGPPTPGPALSQFGCALAKPGTKMTLEREMLPSLWWLSFRLPNGKMFSGVTQSNMYVMDTPRSQQQVSVLRQSIPPLIVEPNGIAQGYRGIRGALVCADYNALMMELRFHDRDLARGIKPQPGSDCSLVPPGTPVDFQTDGAGTPVAPATVHVHANLPDGSVADGESLAAMIKSNSGAPPTR